MTELNSNDTSEIKFIKYSRRRALLPWWIKIFTWFFLIGGALAPIAFIVGLFHFDYQISILGLSTNDPLSVIGLLALSLMTLKGISAFGLWTEKDWAINLGKIDAVISIAVCFITMTYYIFKGQLNLRLELIVLFIYYYQLNKIEYDWVNFGPQEYTDPIGSEQVL